MADTASIAQRVPSLKRLTVLAGALLLAACETIVPRGAPPPEAPPPPPRPVVERPITPELPQDTERHRVALLVPMSGSNARVGQSLANATTLALLDTRS